MKKMKKTILLLVIGVLSMCNTVFATKFIDTVENKEAFADCVFIGDSYTQMLKVYYGASLDCVGKEGSWVEKLGAYIDELIKKDKENIVFFIGPNDYLAQTNPEEFYNILAGYMRRIRKETKSRIFFCSYMDFMYNKISENTKKFTYRIKDYNKKLKQLCKNEDLVFVDLSSIEDVNKIRGLSDQEGEEDVFHYGLDFYNEFMKLLRKDIDDHIEVEKTLIEAMKQLEKDPDIYAASLTKTK